MQHTALPDLSGSVCRYSPFLLAISFAASFFVGLLASLVQFAAVPASLSVALLAEATHAFSDSAMFLPAILASIWFLRKPKEARALGSALEHRVANLMAWVMVASGALAIAFAIGHWLSPALELHPEAGADPALLGLACNGVQLALLSWCGRCRLHRLSKLHLLADTVSSVFVTVELVFELNHATGLPVDSVGGALVGAWLIWQGLRGGHTH
ncbi:MAG: hypothetical protein Q8Q32_03460 [bacterium]|nr:hypothetical protein [bacterium]